MRFLLLSTVIILGSVNSKGASGNDGVNINTKSPNHSMSKILMIKNKNSAQSPASKMDKTARNPSWLLSERFTQQQPIFSAAHRFSPSSHYTNAHKKIGRHRRQSVKSKAKVLASC